MKFSTITALAVLGSNALVAAYEIPNNKVIGKIVDEYLEQDSEDATLFEPSEECVDEAQGVEVCVVAAVTADPAYATRVSEAGETLITCTKEGTITDEAEWETCLQPWFTLLGEKCDLSAMLAACSEGEESVQVMSEVAQDIEYAVMVATDATFLESDDVSQECLDESAGVQVCVVGAIEADPAWGTRVGQAGETLEACTKGWTITDEAEWETCLNPWFTLLSEKCDLSASLEACFGEDVHFASEVAQDIDYAAMIATDAAAAFLEEEPVEEDPCDIESDVLESCVRSAVEADAAWGATLEEAWETVDTCGEGLADDDVEAWTACLTPLFKIMQQKCDTTDYIATCTVSDAQDFVFDITILDSEGLSDATFLDSEEPMWSEECVDEAQGVEVCVVAAVTADPAYATRVSEAGETLMTCTKGWTITDEAEWETCVAPWFTLLGEKCDLSAMFSACSEEDVHFIADFVEDLELDMIAAEVVADEFEEDDGEDGDDDSFELPEGCEEEWDKVEVCIEEAGEADAAWLAALTAAEEEVSACITALYEEENITAESVAACMEDATVLLQQKCDTTAAEEACTPSDILDFHLDLVEDLK